MCATEIVPTSVPRRNGFTPNGGDLRCRRGPSPGSAPERNGPGSPTPSRPALREHLAPGTPSSPAATSNGSGGQASRPPTSSPPPSCRPSAGRNRRGYAENAAGGETKLLQPAPETPPGQLGSLGAGGATHTEVASRPLGISPDVEPDAQPATQDQRRVRRRVDILADVDRANPFTPSPDGTAATWC